MDKILFFLIVLFSSSLNSQILFSEYAEGSSYNKYLEIYNYSSEEIDLSNYAFPSCMNGCDVEGEWDYVNYFPDGATILPGDVYIITHPYATDSTNDYYTEEIAIYSNHQFTYLGNGNDSFGLIYAETGQVLDIIGTMSVDAPSNGWDVAGVTEATKDHTLLRKDNVDMGNNGDWSLSAGTNENDSEWIVLDNETWENLGAHNFSGNTNILGCTDSEALNYNPAATIDDGSCEYALVEGCTDSTACNYDPSAINSLFEYSGTDANMTIALELSVGNLAGLEMGDIIGVFYENNSGDLVCGGSAQWNSESVAIPAWGTETGLDNGFDVGEGFTFIIKKLNGSMFLTTNIMNTNAPFSNTYIQNGFGQIIDLIITDQFIDEENCEYPEEFYDCEGNCLNDADGDGICDEFELSLENQELHLAKCIKVIDLIGQETIYDNFNKVMLYFFDDGSVKKIIKIK